MSLFMKADCTKCLGSALKALLALLCFAGSETVTLESGLTKLVSQVQIGDRLLAATSSGELVFSAVVAVPHSANGEKALFQHLTTASGRDVKLTPLHLIANGPCGSSTPFPLVQAANVLPGSCLQTVDGEDQVATTRTVLGEGAYSFVTQEALVVVNGIVASPFAENHAVGNAYYNIHRAVYAVAPGLMQGSWAKAANLAFGQVVSAV